MPKDSHPQDGPASRAQFPVVGIGASAGGLEAILEFLSALPQETGMAFILVQHLEPHNESHLPEILSRATPMPVVHAQDGQEINPGSLYVAPPNVVLTIRERTLRLAPREHNAHQYYSIDRFFVSLADDLGSRAIAIILSGSSSDGAQGLRAIKSAGGTTFCQNEESAKFGGMPHSAIATGAVDFVLAPKAIATELVRVSSHPYLARQISGTERDQTFEKNHEDVTGILTLLRNATKVDFGQYKQNTIRRRIARRMLVNNLVSARDYLSFIERQPAELIDLFRDILISVTQFFREPEMFDSLARFLANNYPVRDRATPFRGWIAGCSTGEEIYSLAITLTEVLEVAGTPPAIQLFGTDISDSAIDRARTAIFPEAIQVSLSPERLSRFFNRVDAGYRISKAIRESCVFACHDLISDPPFSQLDLVSCRNVLIYLGSAAQQRVLQSLHYSLKPDGILILGSAESIGNGTDLFTPIDSENKIFAKKASPNRLALSLPDPQRREQFSIDRRFSEPPVVTTLAQVETRATRLLRDLYAPPGVTVNEAMQIIHFHGQTSLYLEPPSGEASLNLFRVAHQSLLFVLRKAIDMAAAKQEPVQETGVRFERNGNAQEINLRIIPFTESAVRYYLILFEDHSGDRPVVVNPSAISAEAMASGFEATQVRRELDETRDYLRKVIEQHEVAIEELRAAHEEVQSSNEEMQSTNEELRTAKEELQSSNEELITVNDELQNLNGELGGANNDLTNVLNAVNLPIVLVGMDFCIRRYTPPAERVLFTSPTDIGRLITDVMFSGDVPGLKVMLNDAIQTLAVQHSKIRNRDGRWHSVMVRPYRTSDDRIDGAVITFIDIDDLTQALAKAESSRDFAEGMLESIQHPLLVLDHELRVQRVTSAFYRVFQSVPEDTEGQHFSSLGNGQWNIPKLRGLLEEALIRDVPFRDLDIEHEFPRLGLRTMRLNARRIAGNDRSTHTILLAIEDVTERKEAAEIQYRAIFESAQDGVLVIDSASGRIVDANPYFLSLVRYRRAEIVGHLFSEIPPFLRAVAGRTLVQEAQDKETARFDTVLLEAQDGRQPMVEIIANRYRVRDQILIQANIRDVTDRRRAEDDLRRSNLDLQQFAFAASHDLQEPLRTVISQIQLFERNYKGKLDADADQIIRFITGASGRMRQMVLDLLSYAQTARVEINVAPTNMEAVLATALSNLQLATESVNAVITFDPLPTVMMDSTQLLQLLQNLIGNALKYRGPEAPQIHLSARPAGNEWVISVRDNGLGIDAKYHDYIFTVFKRLHGQEYPGTGIGLATCKRIIERHGGRIWVESAVGEGSTFFFTINAATPDEK